MLGDFGFACKVNDCHCGAMAVGSEEYNAPELYQIQSNQQQNDRDDSEAYDGFKADVFSLGVTLFLMIAKCPPFRTA